MRRAQFIVLVLAFLGLLTIVLFLLNAMGAIHLGPCPCESSYLIRYIL